MTKLRNKTAITAITLVLMLTFSTVAMVIPFVSAQKIPINVTFAHYQKVGLNSPTRLAWRFSQNLLSSPAFLNQHSVMANASVTLTRPDNTTVVINGPFKMRPDTPQGRVPDVVLIYAPDMMGNWTVDFYWPGDSTYDAANQTGDWFVVGPHFPRRASDAQLSFRPYPNVGLGQIFLINAWITPPPYDAWDIYENYTFTITSPLGASTEIGPLNSEQPGTCFIEYALTELGDWDITFSFPGDFMTEPSSVTRTITVQEDFVPVGYPDTPLPTEEWTFPINSQNREWRNIAGPWYQAQYNASEGAWNPYTEAPRTAHILWKLGPGGPDEMIGGYIGSPHSIQTGSGRPEYGGLDAGLYGSDEVSIYTVMAGRGYYNAGGMIHCVDIRTGEELWAVEGGFDVGATRNRDAVLYDFGSNFRVYNAINGRLMLDVPSLNGWTFFEDPYVYRETGGRLIKWDTSGSTSNFQNRVVWNVSSPYTLYSIPNVAVSSTTAFERFSYTHIHNGLWVGVGIYNTEPNTQITVDQSEIIAFNTTTGEEVYNKLVSDPSDPTTWIYKQGPMSGSGYGIWYQAQVHLASNEGRGWTAFDVATGDLAWHSEAADYPWGNFWSYMPEACAYGMILATGYSGIYALNVTNGEILWHYIAEDPYFEEPYGSNIAPDGSIYSGYSFGSRGPVVGGGVIFAPNTEHSPTFLYRGQSLHAVDVFTGEKVWSIKGIYRPTAIAYGTLLAADEYNGMTYAFGKGNTETTCSVSSKVINKGEPVLIDGTVMDMSPAQPGTPAISDEYQTEWMEYLHMQQPLPTDATGVPVELFAESGGVTYTIGTVTTDCDGIFKYLWYPPDEGAYSVFAVFNGDDSYYSSYGITTVGVGKAVSAGTEVPPETAPPTTAPPTTAPPTTAPPTTAPPTTAPPTTEPPTGAPFPTEIAIIAAVAVAVVIGIGAYWILRRRE